MWLFAIFAGTSLIEIALFILIGGSIGLWPTLGVVVLTAAVGTWLVRMQGLSALQWLRDTLSQFRNPSEPLAHGAMILVAGALLLTPGFFTDGIGFALLIPRVRIAVFRYFSRHFNDALHYETVDTETGFEDSHVDIADSEFSKNSPNPVKSGGSGWTRH